MGAAKWIFPGLIIVLGGFWVIDFMITGEPNLAVAIIVMVLGIFTAVILPRLGKSADAQSGNNADKTTEPSKDESSDA